MLRDARMRKIVFLFVLMATGPVVASTLFDDHSVLEVTLTGPLSSVIADKRKREQRPFVLSANGETFNVNVRIRGNSRVQACPFPPLRLNFKKGELKETSLEGEDKLKLVTHCRNGSEGAQDSVLNEYSAYRAFEAISPFAYRVRLLKVNYVDTDGKQPRLAEPQYGFLIESDEGLAKRLGGQVEKPAGIAISDLNPNQAAQMSLFQYFIGNVDWSFVKADDADTCCHNLDLIRVDGKLLTVPYDFDLAAITRANYRRMGNRLEVSSRRDYTGYCGLSADSLMSAMDKMQQRQDDIVAVMQEVPTIAERNRERRVSFAVDFFDELADRDRLMTKFENSWIGER